VGGNLVRGGNFPLTPPLRGRGGNLVRGEQLGGVRGEKATPLTKNNNQNPKATWRQHPLPLTPPSPKGCCLIFWGKGKVACPNMICSNTPLGRRGKGRQLGGGGG